MQILRRRVNGVVGGQRAVVIVDKVAGKDAARKRILVIDVLVNLYYHPVFIDR
jgi:hypothetical protein